MVAAKIWFDGLQEVSTTTRYINLHLTFDNVLGTGLI